MPWRDRYACFLGKDRSLKARAATPISGAWRSGFSERMRVPRGRERGAKRAMPLSSVFVIL